MTNEEFNILVELIKALANDAVIEARPMHNRLAKNDNAEHAIEYARCMLVNEVNHE